VAKEVEQTVEGQDRDLGNLKEEVLEGNLILEVGGTSRRVVDHLGRELC